MILVNLPGQAGTQFNYNKYPLLNNSFYAECLDLLLYHLHERGTINFLDSSEGAYSLIGFGNGANTALYFAHMLLNDTTSTLRSLALVNPYTHLDAGMSASLHQALEGLRSRQHSMLLLDNMLHSSENQEKTLELLGPWQWPAGTREQILISYGLTQNVPL